MLIRQQSGERQCGDSGKNKGVRLTDGSPGDIIGEKERKRGALMKLELEQMKAITKGVMDVTEQGGVLCFTA